MKRILVVYYSQSGQLERVARALTAPLHAAGHALEYLRLEPVPAFPFPWSFWNFLDAFPETVQLQPPPLRDWQAAARYDLVLLCWTPWFLAPAPPVTAFLQSERGRRLLTDTPVVTVTAARNMWVLAQETVKNLLAAAGARHCDHVALTDPGHTLVTVVTTPRWMLTGRRDAWLGLPPAGLTELQIAARARFGRALAAALADGTLDGRRAVLTGLAAATVDPALAMSEKIGRRSFGVWSKIVASAGGPGASARRPVLAVYVAFLVLMIITVVPVSLLIRSLLKPFMRERLAQRAAVYERPSGSGTERLREFS
jgi:hypothetical protein